jgi:hypothetical protein
MLLEAPLNAPTTKRTGVRAHVCMDQFHLRNLRQARRSRQLSTRPHFDLPVSRRYLP